MKTIIYCSIPDYRWDNIEAYLQKHAQGRWDHTYPGNHGGYILIEVADPSEDEIKLLDEFSEASVVPAGNPR